MKRTFSVLVLAILIALPAYPQDAVTVKGFGQEQVEAADPISIIGPTEANSGNTVVCRLAGTPGIDLTKPLLEQLQWLMGPDQMFAYIAMPGQALVPLDVEGTIVFGAGGATMRPQVSFPVADAGEYRLIIDWNFGQNQLVSHTITVGGPDPDPFPGPDPQPLPPLSKMWVIVVEETKQRTPAQAQILLDPILRKWLTTNGHEIRIVDQDQPSADLKGWVAKAGDALPYLFLVGGDGGDPAWRGPLPETRDEMRSLCKQWGAEK